MSTSIFSNPIPPSNYPGAVSKPHVQSSAAPGFFTRKEVSRVSTLSEWQLTHLSDWGIEIHSERRGRHRCYSPFSFFLVLLVRELQAREFPFEAIRRIVRQVSGNDYLGLPWTRDLRWMLTNGFVVHFIAEPNVVLAFLEQRRHPHFIVISLSAIEQRMKLARPSGFRTYAAEKKPLVREYLDRREEKWA